MDDIFVTQEKISCQVSSRLLKMGFLDPGCETDHLEPGKIVKLPLWYVKELKINNPYLIIQIPELYKNVHNAICEAESTNIDLGKMNMQYYEYGRYLASFDRNHSLGRILYETCRQRVRHLLTISKNTVDEIKSENKMDSIERGLYEAGIRTNTLYTNWLQQKNSKIRPSELVQEHSKKRKRFTLSDDEMSSSLQSTKRSM